MPTRLPRQRSNGPYNLHLEVVSARGTSRRHAIDRTASPLLEGGRTEERREAIPFALRLLRDLLRRLDRTTEFVVVVEPGADLDALAKIAGRLDAAAQARIRFVPLRTISVFPQDNARAARDARGRAVLLVPRSFRATGARADDEIDPSVAERAFGVPVRRSRLYWEGGTSSTMTTDASLAWILLRRTWRALALPARN